MANSGRESQKVTNREEEIEETLVNNPALLEAWRSIIPLVDQNDFFYDGQNMTVRQRVDLIVEGGATVQEALNGYFFR